MPSPFPDMDPYLEGALWTTFHFALGAEIVRQLAPRLRPRYLVLPVEPLLDDEAMSMADGLLRTAGLRPA
jgi:uncharacterized protein DUF4058